jgi:hypothetical protein
VSITEADEGAGPGEAITLKVADRDVVLPSGEIVWEADAARELALEFVSTESLLPRVYSLAQNTPNPFNPTTSIAYEIPGRVDGVALASTRVELRVYDIRGRVVRTLVSSQQAPGRYRVSWDGRDDRGQLAGSGVYFYRLSTDSFSKSRKMILVK